jgi:Pathogenicity locus
MPSSLARKAKSAAQCQRLEELPNIGPALASDLRLLGIEQPSQLANADGFALYRALCRATGQRHDPCVLDTFLAAVDFMRGAPAAPWWHYTAERKRVHGQAYFDLPSAAG